MKVPYTTEMTLREAYDAVLDDVWTACVEVTRIHRDVPDERVKEAVGGVFAALFPAWFPVDLSQVEITVDGVADEHEPQPEPQPVT